MIKKIFFIGALLLALCLIGISTSYAAGQGGTIVSDIVTKFHNELSKYESVMLKHAKVLFYWCAVLEVAWLGIKMALGTSDIRETIKNFCFVLLAAGFFLAVINNYHTWTWNVINGLKAIAGEATTITDASDRPFTVGLRLANSLFAKCSGWSPLESLTYILAGMAILFCFTLITLQIILIKCECIVAMCASSILLGLGATSFLRDYAINVLRYIFAVAFKLMTMQLVMGIGINFISQLEIVEKINWGQIGVTISFCVIFYCLVKTLPDVVAGIIQGSHVSTGNALTSTVAAMGAGMMGIGMAAGAGAANIGRAAQAAKAQGAEGVGGMLKGTASNLWNATREASHNKGQRSGTVASSLRERIESARIAETKAKTGAGDNAGGGNG
ncbi:P-type conjugative transfer protein TrbL [uncultured Desulfovibrio sp.]|uniref:P-type conjugative transfer protein TrbL n=1 Tax=uncultured Desulfovibrio sp. TaxID=167968 RepID=UPI00261BB478|nr:P-type conjugative transfer protein TrbL [uncultured Desulfovibrio sp.]